MRITVEWYERHVLNLSIASDVRTKRCVVVDALRTKDNSSVGFVICGPSQIRYSRNVRRKWGPLFEQAIKAIRLERNAKGVSRWRQCSPTDLHGRSLKDARLAKLARAT